MWQAVTHARAHTHTQCAHHSFLTVWNFVLDWDMKILWIQNIIPRLTNTIWSNIYEIVMYCIQSMYVRVRSMSLPCAPRLELAYRHTSWSATMSSTCGCFFALKGNSLLLNWKPLDFSNSNCLSKLQLQLAMTASREFLCLLFQQNFHSLSNERKWVKQKIWFDKCIKCGKIERVWRINQLLSSDRLFSSVLTHFPAWIAYMMKFGRKYNKGQMPSISCSHYIAKALQLEVFP